MCCTLEQTLSKAYSKYFPMKTKYICKKRFEKPWLTSGILRSIKVKSNYFKLYKLGLISHEINNRFKNKLTQITRTAKKNYYKNKFENCKGNLRETWRGIRAVLGGGSGGKRVAKLVCDGNDITDPTDIADTFNKYFTSIARELDEKVPPSNIDPISYLKYHSASSFFLTHVTPSEIEIALNKIKIFKKTNDVIPVKILSHVYFVFN